MRVDIEDGRVNGGNDKNDHGVLCFGAGWSAIWESMVYDYKPMTNGLQTNFWAEKLLFQFGAIN